MLANREVGNVSSVPADSDRRALLDSLTEPLGVRNSDHPCDLRLRASWPPARDRPIAPPGGPARGTCPRTE
jgi:hypothetical protein